MPRKNLLNGTRDAFVEPRDEESIRTWTALAGALLVAIGGYLPWLRYNPNYEGVGIVLSPLTRMGFHWFDAVLVVPVGLVVAALAVRGSTKWWRRAMAVVAIATVLLPTFFAVRSYRDPNPYFVPDVGLVVSTLGGLVLLLVVGYDRYTGN